MASEVQKLSDGNLSSPRHSKHSDSRGAPAGSYLHVKRQSSDEDQAMVQGTSTFDYSADTYSRSKGGGTRDQIDSYSDDEDAIYVPFEYKGDGRKREAKKHKMQAIVARDEIEIDRMIRDY
jgi:hypothetical protein